MTTSPRVRVVRLFGPALDDVVRFVRSLEGDPHRTIAWDDDPEVHVKCSDPEVAEAIVARFGAAVYSLSGEPFEAAVGATLVAAGRTLATAESCTGGLVGELVTRVPGSSTYYRGGIVAYSNDVKVQVLGVPADVIAARGAVSGEVVLAMAEGARRVCGADFGVAVSGVAGPGGGSAGKPVGTVWLAIAGPRGARAIVHRFGGDRERVRRTAAFHALDLVRREVIEGEEA